MSKVKGYLSLLYTSVNTRTENEDIIKTPLYLWRFYYNLKYFYNNF